jgi:hypothetical protein
MRRLLAAAGVLAGLGLSAAGARAQESVIYYDPAQKKDVSVSGTVEDENAVGVQLRVSPKDVKTIPAEDVRHVSYKLDAPNPGSKELDDAYGTEFQALQQKDLAERKKGLESALAMYQALDKRFTPGKQADWAKRYVQYRMALVAVELAKDDPAKSDAAVKALTDFKTANPQGWEAAPAVKTLAALLEDKGDIKGAQQAYEGLAENKELPAAVRQGLRLKGVRLLMRAGDFKGAEDRLKAMGGELPPDDPQRGYVTVYLAQCRLAQGAGDEALKKQLEGAAAGGDDGLKAAAHNTLGEWYDKAKQPDEAFWQYLRVDTLYGQDREEEAKALYHLWKLFDTPRGDVPRAQQCYQKLTGKEFAGTEYQERALKEKPKDAGGDKKGP